MGFVQIVEYQTSRVDEVEKLIDDWREQTQGQRTAQRAIVCSDRERPNTYITVVQFDSYEAAMKNSELPATGAMAEQMAKLCDGPPSFRNLDVVEVMEA